MASPSCFLFRPRPPLCSRRRRSSSRSLYLLSKQSLHRLPSPRTCRRPVAEQLVLRSLPPGNGRRMGATGFACYCSYDTENGLPTPSPDKGKSSDEWPILRRWDVPWEWPTISLTMVACAVSFLLTGIAEQSILEQLGFRAGETTLDEKAEILFLGQLYRSKVTLLAIFCFCKCSSTTVVVLGVIFGMTNTFRPFSDDIFRYGKEFNEPLKLQNGWLLWSAIGLFVAIVAIALAGAAMTFLNGETPQRETDSLVLLLPLIGSSNISTACLLGITGILAPILEETVFRGFLMVSLTMWFPTPYAVLMTAAVFAFAHFTPGEFPQLFVLGVVLGFSYAQTRNLLTPIAIHAVWNSGVILLLTFLQMQGYDIREILQAS
ncbi:CAAX amino terminal protease family protein [Zea mays]|uniref:CAAX amino terminal protease family protein n=2 Tax=Zea mays TaxID=4577 RepID=A0A1D6KP00_MAIZE|nr:CAAX amino terminal protease family protein [Zea mays]